MTIDQEAAKWSQQCDEAADKYREQSLTLAGQAAAMGYHKAPGEIQGAIVDLGQMVKGVLTAANAEIYKGALTWLFKIHEVDDKVRVGLQKLDESDYSANLENQTLIERAAAETSLDQRRADLEIAKSQIERRQAAIIEERARTQAEIVYWKTLQVQAEGLSLDAEVDLINEKVKTAEAKLAIITDLYAVIAAEQLVVEAEQRRAAALQLVLVAERELAAVKETMIPLYQQKAQARLNDAAAITSEVDVKRKIEELGYEKIELRNQEEQAEHEIRDANLFYERTQTNRRKSDIALQLAQAQARTIMTQYENTVRAAIIELKKQLDKDEKGYQSELRWFWRQFEVIHNTALMEWEKFLYLKELADKLSNIDTEARDQCTTVQAGGRRKSETTRGVTEFRAIRKG